MLVPGVLVEAVGEECGVRFVYADPPYLGYGRLYTDNHPDSLVWDDPETHRRLIERLSDEWPDGWVLSLVSSNLHDILPMCPRDARIGAWVKPFASFKPGVPVAHAWEPVIFRGGRRRGRNEPTTRDWVACNITLQRGLVGAKPRGFCHWVFDLLGAERGDTLDDLFPGTGAVTAAWRERSGEPHQMDFAPLFIPPPRVIDPEDERCADLFAEPRDE